MRAPFAREFEVAERAVAHPSQDRQDRRAAIGDVADEHVEFGDVQVDPIGLRGHRASSCSAGTQDVAHAGDREHAAGARHDPPPSINASLFFAEGLLWWGHGTDPGHEIPTGHHRDTS
jgi:hypothetical protein